MKAIFSTLLTFLGLSTAHAESINTNTPYQEIKSSEVLESFGYKTTWYVISNHELTRKNLTLQDIAKHLKLTEQKQLSWNDGLTTLNQDYQQSSTVFITPNLNDYIYIIVPVNEDLNLIHNLVGNYFAFTSYRVVDAVAWKIVQDNEIVRYFQYSNDEDERYFYNIGQQIPAERQLKLPNLSGLNLNQAIEAIYDDFDKNQENSEYLGVNHEDIPAKINELLTGQNPTEFSKLSIHQAQGLGILGQLPQ